MAMVYGNTILKPKTEVLKMEQIQYPEEKKDDHCRYILQKYLNSTKCYEIIFSQLDDGKLERILNDIRKEGKIK